LNLPAVKKFVKPFYKMLWAEKMAKLTIQDAAGKKTHIELDMNQCVYCYYKPDQLKNPWCNTDLL